MIGWYRAWRRKRIVAKPVPRHWLRTLAKRVAFFRELPDEDREPFLKRLKIFVAEKHFISAGGMKITDEVKVVIAAAAARLILKLPVSYYDRLTEIVVYPGDYLRPDEEDSPYMGEAHDWGVVVFSWKAVLEGMRGSDDGINAALHEFAHVLDRAEGHFDGTPALGRRERYQEWSRVMTEHFLKLRKECDAELAALDEYGAESEAEFFAVATEAFFERPDVLLEELPDLYDELKRFYLQDPAKARK
jgi:hypothetical protein